jgi:SAM-dependent methyltransferase
MGVGSAKSFRDPLGSLVVSASGVSRLVQPAGVPDVTQFLQSPLAQNLMDSGRLVRTWEVERNQDGSLTLGHEPIPFPCYPSEWPAEMLHSAADLSLDIAERSLDAGYGLKDATPYNILFRGSDPVFVDFLSFEIRQDSDPVWLPHAQFVRTFLLPLLRYKMFGLPTGDVFVRHRDGLEADDLESLASWIQKFHPSMLSLATLPILLNRVATKRGPSLYRRKEVNPKLANFTLRRLFSAARKKLDALEPIPQTSRWTAYKSLEHSRNAEGMKAEFASAVIGEFRNARVLDIGCNTGQYSLALARLGASVVGIDSDPAVVGRLFHAARQQRQDVLPLVVDIARPTPGAGWRNEEEASFLERATGHFDCVLMFGILHHLLVSERIPLDKIIDLASDLTTKTLLVEFVPTDDPMFQEIVRGRGHLHGDVTIDNFRKSAGRKFRIIRSASVPCSGRVLFQLQK